MDEDRSPDAHWDEVARIFDAAVDRSSDQREAFLDAECASDPSVRQAVESLLEAHEDAGAFFADLQASVFGAARPNEPGEKPGKKPERAAGDGEDPYLGKTGRVGPYRLLGRVGAGGMGVVYKARDTRLDRLVALKVLPPGTGDDTDARARFQREAQSAAALQHPNACTVHDVGPTPDGGLYIAMPLYRGPTLAERIDDGPLAPPAARRTALQMTRALAQAHRAGILHRDVKPSNVVLPEAGEEAPGGAKVIDFGLAKDVDLELTRPGTVMGTIAYMSPEQTRGAVADERADVWAVGVCLYEMLTGEHPFERDTQAGVLDAIRNQPPPSLEAQAVPADLRRVVERCLQKSPEDRYPDAEALRAALEKTTGSAGERASRDGERGAEKGRTSNRWKAKGRSLTALIAGAVLAVVLVAGAVAGGVLSLSARPALPEPRHVVVAASGDGAENEERASPEKRSPGLAAGLVRAVTQRLRTASVRDSSVWIAPPSDAPDSLGTAQSLRKRYGATLLLRLDAERDSTRPDAARVNVGLSLVDTRTGRVLRRARVTETTAGFDALPDTLAEAAASMMGMRAEDLAPRPQPETGRAHQFYVEGRGRLRHHHVPGNVDAALSLFRRAVELDSAYARGFAGLGEAYWRRYTATHAPAWIDSAMAAGERALLLDGDLPEAHGVLGRVDAEQGRLGSAIAHYRYALRRRPSFVRARRGLARALEAAGRPGEAEAAYRRVIEQAPAYWGGHNDLGKYFVRRGRYGAAVEQFERVVDLAPHNAVGHRNLGAAHFLQGDLAAATDAYRRALALAPDYATHTNLGSVLMARGRYAEAADAFRDALDLQTADHRVWGSLAEALHWSGRRDSARVAFRAALERARRQVQLNPRDVRAQTAVASYRADLGDSAQARAALDEAVALARSAGSGRPAGTGGTSAGVDVQMRIGAVFAVLGDSSRAYTWFRRAVRNGYRFKQKARYPRLSFLWDDPAFRALVQQSRRDS